MAADPLLVSKHRFLKPDSPRVFQTTSFEISNTPSGSNFAGGFMAFEEVAGSLGRGEYSERANGDKAASSDLTFRSQVELVEIHATVTGARGRYADGLSRDDFAVLDSGEPANIALLEDRLSAVSVALLLDGTASVLELLPSIKASALKLIGHLRPIDSIAVYAFDSQVVRLQGFTRDKNAAKRAVLRLFPLSGATALNDALSRIAFEISNRGDQSTWTSSRA
jgi:hypothetical protein